MSGMIDKINQENRDLAEIEKVARFDAKAMFWQWVSVGKWFLGGVFDKIKKTINHSFSINFFYNYHY